MFTPGIPVAILDPPTVVTLPTGGGDVGTEGIFVFTEDLALDPTLVDRLLTLRAFKGLGAAMDIFIISSTIAAIISGLIACRTTSPPH